MFLAETGYDPVNADFQSVIFPIRLLGHIFFSRCECRPRLPFRTSVFKTDVFAVPPTCYFYSVATGLDPACLLQLLFSKQAVLPIHPSYYSEEARLELAEVLKPRNAFQASCIAANVLFQAFQREGDSNPWETFASSRFPSVCLRPLGHLSISSGPIRIEQISRVLETLILTIKLRTHCKKLDLPIF